MSRIGVDTGGTFTDVLVLGRDGKLRALKLPSTPRDPAEAVIAGVRTAADAAELVEVVHSTTVATNALLQRSGPAIALVTTAGFEDVLEIGRQARPRLYALSPEKPEPLVPAERRFGLDERLAPDGSVLRAPTDEALERVRAEVQASGAQAVAICLLHAYANPAHEQAVARALAPLGLPLSLSSEVLPVLREYERTSTTVVNAYAQPVMAPYLERLGQALQPARVRVMQSNGGVLEARDAARAPVRTLLSGPAAGVIGALEVARAAGLGDAITLDMGGTSTDVALIAAGALGLTEETAVAGCPIQLPMLAVHTVGAGGGSIARLDAGGALKVGPASQGAEPGPAAYGRGGTLPTVTDADLVLGRLDAARFLGGAMRLDVQAARAALAGLAAQLGKPVEAAAEDVVAVADAVMARAIKSISVERGLDPARFALLPFGGAGGLHACAVAAELGMTRVLVPPEPGLLCAYGALAADVLHELVHTLLLGAERELPLSALAVELDRLAAEAERRLDADGVPGSRRAIERTATLRYRGQSYSLAVPLPAGDGDDLDLVAAFHAAHRARYGYALERPVELETLRVRAIGRAERSLERSPEHAVTGTPALAVVEEEGEPSLGRSTCIHGGRAYGAEVLARARLRPGALIDGPALLCEYSATTFLPPGAHAEVLPSGALDLRLA